MGQGLTVVAYGPDEVIEALEYQANDFTLGVQFHPEKSSDAGARLLQNFVSIVKGA